MRLWCSLCLVVLLAGCASIPLSTAVRLSRLDEKTVLQLDPSQVRVRVAVPEGFALDIEHATLALALSHDGRDRHEDTFGLKLLSAEDGTRNGGLFEGKVPVRAYELMLAPDGIAQMRALQQVVRQGHFNELNFSVSTPLAAMPPDARAIRFWTELRFTAGERYMTLLDGARIEIVDDRH